MGNYVRKIPRKKAGLDNEELAALKDAVSKAERELAEAKKMAANPKSGQEDEAEQLVKEREKDLERLNEALEKKEAEPGKVDGAEKILQALAKSGKATCLTKYDGKDGDSVKESPMIKAFVDKPGTIWGFEDVRRPYVQAARETEKGQQPIRMWEIWDAVDSAIGEKGYNYLYQDPDAAIPEFVEIGVKKITKLIRTPDHIDYAGADETKFIEKFREQAESYLKHLAKTPPKGQFAAVNDPAGVQSAKLMGGLGCKAGLHWAKEKGEPVYYCIDGIDMKQATSYKQTRNDNIQAKLDDPNKPVFAEVITFAEIREILKHWDKDKEDDLSGTVKFFAQGKLIERDDPCIQKWIKDMQGVDETAGHRPAPKADKYKDRLDKLNPDLFKHLDEGGPKDKTEPDPDDKDPEATKKRMDGKNADRNALRIMRASANLKRSARGKLDLLLAFLKTKQCLVLSDWSLIPKGLAETFEAARDAENELDREAPLGLLKKKLALVHVEYRAAIEAKLLEPFLPKTTATTTAASSSGTSSSSSTTTTTTTNTT
jgi:hypothetical protein